MKQSKTLAASIAVLAVAIAVLAFVLETRQGVPASPKSPQADTAPALATTTAPAQPLPQVPLESFQNYESGKEVLANFAQSQYYYKIDWKHIVEVDTDNGPVYIGFLERSYGNGEMDTNPEFMIASNGRLFTSYGISGNIYPVKETNWVWRFKDGTIPSIAALEYHQGADREEQEVSRVESGIDNIAFTANEDGALTHVEFSIGEKQYKFDAPFKEMAPVNFVTRPELAGKGSLSEEAEATRKLPGKTGGLVEMDSDMGYTIGYPESLDGDTVSVVHDGKYQYRFMTGDTPGEQDVASVWCTPNSQDQIGPKKGEPDAIAVESRSKLVDWGKRQDYHSDAFSFTAPGFYCQMQALGAFRLNMFRISF